MSDLLEVLREHAYGAISLEECLTIMPTEHGAKVPSHWVEEDDARIASVLSEKTLRDELSRREQEPTA
jgi:hypothetical protein